MKLSKLALLTAVMMCGSMLGAHAQQPAKPKPAPRTAQTTPAPATSAAPAAAADPAAAPPQPGWAARCSSASRAAPLECAVEETAVLSKTGQVIVVINIRVPNDTHVPVMLVQLPLGLNLPAGARFQVDDGKTTDLQIQTCENRGCYASTTLAPDALAALKSGQQVKVSFQTMNKEAISIPMPLADFAPAYDKIK